MQTLKSARPRRWPILFFAPPFALLALALVSTTILGSVSWSFWIALAAIALSVIAASYYVGMQSAGRATTEFLARRINPLVGSVVFFAIVFAVTLLASASQSAPLEQSLVQALSVSLVGIISVWAWLWLLYARKKGST